MQPIIFLDFDGVLNSLSSVLAYRKCSTLAPNPIAVRLMARLADEANAHVVISSSWRVGPSLDSLKATLTDWCGVEIAERTIGATPVLNDCRGAEIDLWLKQHSAEQASYVIVDDDGDMLDHQRLHFVQTNHRDGFGALEYIKAMRIIAPEHKDARNLTWYLNEAEVTTSSTA